MEIVFPIEVLSPGLAIGKLYIEKEVRALSSERLKISKREVVAEIERYRKAVFSSKQDLLGLQRKLKGKGSKEAAQILDFHIEMLQDPIMNEKMEHSIRSEQINPETAFKKIITEYENELSLRKSAFIQQKASDVRDLSHRVLKHLNPKLSQLKKIPKGTIYCSANISPSEVASIDDGAMSALGSESASFSSHAVLLAKAKGIPFFAGISMEKLVEFHGEMAVVDGREGNLILNPSEERLKSLTDNIKASNEKRRSTPRKTESEVELMLTISDPKELKLPLERNIGLFRTEFYAIKEQRIPLELEQFELYREIAENLNGHFAIIRTFDFGKDKLLSNKSPRDKSPCDKSRSDSLIGDSSIHQRGLLWLLSNKGVLKQQLRALLRAACYGDLRILIPMVSCSYLFQEFMGVFSETLKDLKKEKVPHVKVPLGCMIETPSSLCYLEEYAESADFFSIGSNDLVQYFLGIDRELPDYNLILKKSLREVLILIRDIALKAKALGKPVYFCGEMGSNPLYFLLLLGCGIKAISAPENATCELELLRDAFPKETLEGWLEELLRGKASQSIQDEIEVKIQGKVENFQFENSTSHEHL